MSDIFILGCGFGTALSVLWNKSGHNVTVYSNNSDEIETIKKDKEHKKLLPGIVIAEEINFTSDITLAKNAEIIVFAVPSKFMSIATAQVARHIPKNAVIVNVAKGFCDNRRLSEVIKDYISNPTVILTGPCHAEEVGRGSPTTVVCASLNSESAMYIQHTLQTPTFRVYINEDIIGCELGGALKNTIALCCGIVSGMGLGDNTIAALMTRGLAEITRLGTSLGAKWQTFTGLAGVGDLIVTCTSKHSRNYQAGILIGQGKTANEAVKQVGTVEGYECVRIVLQLADGKSVAVPIIEQLYRICYEGVDLKVALRSLMERPQRDEKEHYWEFI